MLGEPIGAQQEENTSLERISGWVSTIKTSSFHRYFPRDERFTLYQEIKKLTQEITPIYLRTVVDICTGHISKTNDYIITTFSTELA